MAIKGAEQWSTIWKIRTTRIPQNRILESQGRSSGTKERKGYQGKFAILPRVKYISYNILTQP